MILQFVTLVILKIALARGGCPLRCNCTENAVTCVSKNLEYVPYFESLDNNPVIIDLSGNSINLIDVDDFSFDKSDQVKEIFLNSTELVAIEENALIELENLQELYLADNLLNALPDDFITSNENMILLDISSNYFNDMPKIISNSLEVLAIANSGISKISADALDSLPNLRVLLLQQNSLKHLNPAIFDPMGNLFFVRLAYNPWQCNCRTIELFNYLTTKQFVDITEPVQCQTEDLIFVDIYNEKGVAPEFKTQCDYSGVDFDLELQNLDESYDFPDLKAIGDDTDPNKATPSNELDEEFYFTNFIYSAILCVSIIVSLTVGASVGSCLTYKFMSGNIKQTESTKELLTQTDDNIFNFS